MSARETFIKSLTIGGIYWFVDPQINSLDPHPHVCVGISEDKCAFMFCGTSKFENKRRHFELNGLAFETLVRIQANTTNTITKDTYLNCNDVQVHIIDDLLSNSTFRVRGNVSDSELYQIRNAIETSNLLEEDTKAEILIGFPEL